MAKKAIDLNEKALTITLADGERVEFISTGSIMLNLAISGKGLKGGIPRGRITNLIGDGSSGKTLDALEIAFWAFKNIQKVKSNIFPEVKKLIIVYNNVEGVMDFPITQMYGEEFVKSIIWIRTGTIEEMGRDYTRRVLALNPGESLLYIVDSFDALKSEAAMERFEEAAINDKPEDASYKTEKAKYSSDFFSAICDVSADKDATMIVVSQVREKIDAKTFGDKYYRTGGKSLDFYTHVCVWLAIIEKLKKTFHGEERVYGTRVRCQCKRNKVGKPYREAETIILFDYGIDNISSIINFVWGPKIDKIEFDGQTFDRVAFINYIEENQLEEVLAEMAEEEWQKIEDAVSPKRKKRY